MAKPTLYQVLGLPSTATRTEIRSAYQCQMARVRVGELPPALEQKIERAYVTLDNPDHRVRYDVELAASSQSTLLPPLEGAPSERRTPAGRFRPGTPLAALLARGFRFPTSALPHLAPPRVRLPQWRPPAWKPMIITAVPVLAGVCAILVLSPSRGGHRPPEQAPQVTSRAGTLAGSENTEAPTQAAIANTPAQSTPAQAQAPDETSNTSSPPTASSSRAPASAAVAASVPQYRAPQVARQPVYAAPAPAAEDVPEADAPVAAEPAPAPDLEATATVSQDAPSPSSPGLALVWSSPIKGKGAKYVTRVGGSYCHDRSGGEVFMPLGVPVPANLTC